MADLSDFLNVLTDDVFEERPVDLQTWLYSKDHMGLMPLSDVQEKIIELGSNIYFEETWVELVGKAKAKKLMAMNKKELLFLLGKGAGKDLMSEIICLRIVYLLLCLKDPAAYYGKPAGDYIDIVNVAANARQASNVFFAGLKTRLKHCKWFNGRYKARALDIEFDKSIRIHSLNSENEGTEGLNVMVAVLDELDSFDEGDTTDNANKMYKTLSATVSSRFDKQGKVLVLSFPRRKDGFIMNKYNEFVLEKEVVKYQHTFVLNRDLPPGTEGNEFTIEWEEDEIISYRYDNVWALRRPTWRVNPTKTPDSFMTDFYSDVNDALGRFAACPQDTDGIHDWYRDKARIDALFSRKNGVDTDGSINIKPDPDKEYYIHVDLALVQDNAAVALAHVDKFAQVELGNTLLDPAPFVIVDLVRYWKPSKERPLDFSDIRAFIISIRKMGFDIRKVTFDRWQSDQIIQQLNGVGIVAEKLSVAKDHYSEFALLMGEGRVTGPDSDLLKKEMKTLIINDKGKVDHPGRTGNDLSDAVCGAIWNAANLTEMPDETTEIVTFADIARKTREEKQINNNVIRPEKTSMPDAIADFLDGIRVL